MLGLLLLFALNWLSSALFSRKTALLITNQNGEIFSCILLDTILSYFNLKKKYLWKPNLSFGNSIAVYMLMKSNILATERRAFHNESFQLEQSSDFLNGFC